MGRGKKAQLNIVSLKTSSKFSTVTVKYSWLFYCEELLTGPEQKTPSPLPGFPEGRARHRLRPTWQRTVPGKAVACTVISCTGGIIDPKLYKLLPQPGIRQKDTKRWSNSSGCVHKTGERQRPHSRGLAAKLQVLHICFTCTIYLENSHLITQKNTNRRNTHSVQMWSQGYISLKILFYACPKVSIALFT